MFEDWDLGTLPAAHIGSPVTGWCWALCEVSKAGISSNHR